MKKLSLLLAILLIVSFSVSADPDATTDLHIGTVVATDFGVVIHEKSGAIGLEDWPLTAVGTVENPLWLRYDNDGASQDDYRDLRVTIRTNTGNGYKVTATAAPLSASGISTKIGYSVKVGSDPEVSVLKTDNTKSIDLIPQTAKSGNGLQFITNDFKVTLNGSDFDVAEAATYATVWTVDLIVN